MPSITYRRIDPGSYPALAVAAPDTVAPGDRPSLKWLKIADLRVDPLYQRHVLRAGERNVIRIAAEFRWSRFAPVIVAPAEGGGFAIIDGQHRTLAAALAGLTDVPCQVIEIDRADQARAFAAINGQVTPITALQLHASRVASGDAAARALNDACARGGVTICRYPVPGNKMKVGETTAVGTLARFLRSYGAAVLVPALTCITGTRDGNPGYVRAPIVGALCAVIESEPDFAADEKRLVKAMQTFDFARAFLDASQGQREGQGSIESLLVDRIADHLEMALAKGASTTGKGKR